jgi:adenosylmethionine-8-amino-7-oxononanoate aminotransferase
MPLAATVASDKVFQAFFSDDPEAALMHGPTYMAYPLGCAAANASLDLFASEPRLAQVAAIESQLEAELSRCRGLHGVVDVRVKGAIGVVQMAAPVNSEKLRERFAAHGCWIRPFGDVIYLTPPFVIEDPDLSTLTRAIHSVLQET